ncbi:hypothetical protein ABZ434_00710 [Streptomyces sp. NPDC005761]|uniref:hypothetical protein n=1 Tax=unclassified Streptomyces TaxID=2593676 RepID=UPI0033F27B63
MRSRRRVGWSGTALAPATALLTAALLGRAWNACDAGVNSSANSTFLLVLFVPVLTIVLLAVWLSAVALLGRRPLVAAAAGAALVLTASWGAVSLFLGDATYYCPDGVPPWWPDALPAPGW